MYPHISHIILTVKVGLEERLSSAVLAVAFSVASLIKCDAEQFFLSIQSKKMKKSLEKDETKIGAFNKLKNFIKKEFTIKTYPQGQLIIPVEVGSQRLLQPLFQLSLLEILAMRSSAEERIVTGIALLDAPQFILQKRKTEKLKNHIRRRPLVVTWFHSYSGVNDQSYV